ncbi:uncharacterized protein LOC143591810 [Bidens hawaiensis]|uniref:uncharacterized protein LOC143591810 n=1 Tax=Bidens hawaiensis TaxID=980011 RepID=UPI0040495B70
MGFISCYSELTVQLSEKTSCSNHKHVTNSVSTNLVPSIQTSTTRTYKTTLSTGQCHVITVTWHRTAATQSLSITSGDEPDKGFRLNTNSRLFRRKLRGSKVFEINNIKFEVLYDLSSAQYCAGAEPVEKYYVLIMVDSELGLFLGDMYSEEPTFKKKVNKGTEFCLVSRQEHFYGNTLYSTKVQFSGSGTCHDILIRCTDDVKDPTLSVCVDKRVVVRVKRLQLNFRGNQTIFVDGLSIDLMWDVHDWFFGSGSGSGHAFFMFRTRNGLDSRLWLEDKVNTKGENKEFCLLVYATKV